MLSVFVWCRLSDWQTFWICIYFLISSSYIFPNNNKISAPLVGKKEHKDKTLHKETGRIHRAWGPWHRHHTATILLVPPKQQDRKIEKRGCNALDTRTLSTSLGSRLPRASWNDLESREAQSRHELEAFIAQRCDIYCWMTERCKLPTNKIHNSSMCKLCKQDTLCWILGLCQPPACMRGLCTDTWFCSLCLHHTSQCSCWKGKPPVISNTWKLKAFQPSFHSSQPFARRPRTCSSRIQEGTVSRAVLVNSVRGSGAATSAVRTHGALNSLSRSEKEIKEHVTYRTKSLWNSSSCSFCFLCRLSSSHLPGKERGKHLWGRVQSTGNFPWHLARLSRRRGWKVRCIFGVAHERHLGCLHTALSVEKSHVVSNGSHTKLTKGTNQR